MLTMKDIIREGHPTLRKRAEEVSIPPSEKDIHTIQEMMEFLRNGQNEEIAAELELRPGVGLAAPQINISKRIICIRTPDAEDEVKEFALFNPKIISHSQETAFLESGEGCLSVDRAVEGIVPRYARIKVEAFTSDGEKVKLRFRGYEAIVIQHEIDHLDGIMFYDRIEDYNDKFKRPLPSKSVITRSENETVI
ncbi:peptide deformylase [Alkalicoccus halolimnae]|uniref:Peptide deformylase n=1 Tax=Alkalicoccus halolimnae TaxID=1667239 RepID=A0A5C7FDC2_9BACI|nr:peptide deformylase [Alkalicoccus halolimnae]TXF87478.1 peptide deformylase [Alkalicoccus halolimnae]